MRKYIITLYIRKLIEKMLSNIQYKSSNDFLLIAGDVSYNFKISTLFYKELVSQWHNKNIIVVLGNHELWDYNPLLIFQNNRLNIIIQQYRDLCNSLGIYFLQNELLISGGIMRTEKYLFSEEELISIDSETLKERCLSSSLIVLGGLGFSGLNPDINANKGVYRETIKSLNEDIELTRQFESVYKKVRNVLCDRQVVVLTHMPKDNWSNEKYNNN